MRAPRDLAGNGAPRPVRRMRRGRIWLIVVLVVLVILGLSLRSLATIYTDSQWFSSVQLHGVWSTLFFVKVGLFVSFGAIFFILLWVNLIVCDRMGAKAPAPAEEDELVHRYQQVVRPYAGRVFAALAFVLALVAAAGTVGEWNNWILFLHGGSFGITDPTFHKDLGFYIFKLPFIAFVVNWLLASLVVIFVVTAIFHYLNGGIRAQRVTPRIRPAVKAHLSLLLALIALTKAAGYWIQRYQLTTSQNGVVEGPGYTDVHARLPALELLVLVSIMAAVILLYNIWRRGWTLPVLAVGVWAFVALVIGVVYPALLQALKVTPAQSTLELPYIKDNIAATRAAFDLNSITPHNYSASTPASYSAVQAATPTLDSIRLWDPNPAIGLPAFQKLQGVQSYYSFPALGFDRYDVDGTMVPANVGVREINSSQLPNTGWVNTHLVYTHGEGAVVSPSNQTSSSGNPNFAVQNVPSQSASGYPKVKQPDVYFGLGETGWVVANTKQPEFDYVNSAGTNEYTHYTGSGGVQIHGVFDRLAFALRLGDFNLAISSLITNQSRIMFVRDPVAMADKAAPFLTFDSNPYAVVVNGQIDWILDGYTTTAAYPYSQDASTQNLPPTTGISGTGLPYSFNYVRNSVKAVVNAYSGKITFYAWDQRDPILQTYERAFPGMFKPKSSIPAALVAHMRYPSDMFAVQAATYGRYHITKPTNFYSAGNRWQLSPVDSPGTVPQNLGGGFALTQTQYPMVPQYQVMQVPGQSHLSYTAIEAYVPATQGNQTPNPGLAAFMIANSNPSQYGQLDVYQAQVSGNQRPTGPLQADSYIASNQDISQKITLLDQHGSQVLLGNILMIPFGHSILYVQPLYTAPVSGTTQPQLRYVLAVYGTHATYETTLSAALSDVLNTSVSGTSGSTAPPSTSPSTTPTQNQTQVQKLLAQALAAYAQAQTDLHNGNLGAYENDINNMNTAIKQADSLLGAPASSSTATTTTVPGHASTTTTTTKSNPSTGHGSGTHKSSTTTTRPGEA